MTVSKRLRIGIARDNFIDLPKWSSGWQSNEAAYYAAVAEAGYEAVQGGDSEPCIASNLQIFGNGVVREAADAEAFARSWKLKGAVAATCIAGFGYESDEEADAIVRAVLSASDRAGLPIFIETHRASITQDSWRCLRLVERHPGLRFNGDFSHWYTGQEMAAGDFGYRMELLKPIFAKTHFLHGRIGDACCMQVRVNSTRDVLCEPFRQLWTTVMDAFVNDPGSMQELWFFPELLGTPFYYARVFQGREESDRWEQAQLLVEIATECAKQVGLCTQVSRLNETSTH